MAISSYPVSLMYNVEVEESVWEMTELVPIKDFPDLGGSPDMLETTTLQDEAQTYILGIQSLSALEFTANYDEEIYEDIKDLEGDEQEFEVWFGEDGVDGIFEFSGFVDVHVVGAGVNEVVDMIVTIAPSTEVEKQ